MQCGGSAHTVVGCAFTSCDMEVFMIEILCRKCHLRAALRGGQRWHTKRNVRRPHHHGGWMMDGMTHEYSKTRLAVYARLVAGREGTRGGICSSANHILVSIFDHQTFRSRSAMGMAPAPAERDQCHWSVEAMVPTVRRRRKPVASLVVPRAPTIADGVPLLASCAASCSSR